MKTRFVIWVTSDCNLACKYCSQSYTMNQNKGYQMPIEEVAHIVKSCGERGIHFDTIEITGGEPSLWKNIKTGVQMFQQICNNVTLVTNGNDPDLIISLGLNHWGVSSSQASSGQLEKYDSVRSKVFFNGHTHRKLPDKPIENSLPADCTLKNDPHGNPQNAMAYILGKVYYCCNAFALSERVGMSDNIVCDFEEDFVSKFENKTFNEPICSVCLCNPKVWNSI